LDVAQRHAQQHAAGEDEAVLGEVDSGMDG
jgi:hypothetical protein